METIAALAAKSRSTVLNRFCDENFPLLRDLEVLIVLRGWVEHLKLTLSVFAITLKDKY